MIWKQTFLFGREDALEQPARTIDYQAKIHTEASEYAKDINNAQYKNVEFVGGSGQGINDTVNVHIGKKQVSSDALTPDKATKLADSMKAQKAPEYSKSAEKHAELNRVNLGRAVAAGAATGAILSITKEVIDVIKNRDNLSEDQFIKSIEHILAARRMARFAACNYGLCTDIRKVVGRK